MAKKVGKSKSKVTKLPSRDVSDKDLAKAIKQFHADITSIRQFGKKKKWSEIRLAMACVGAADAFENWARETDAEFEGIPTIADILNEINQSEAQNGVH